MFRRLHAVVVAAVSFGALAVPAGAQNFLESSAETIPAGDFAFTADPTGLFGKNGRPDRWGGAARLGYGLTDSFDVEAKAAVFNGFSLVGLDTDFWVVKGPVNMSVGLGAHKALVQSPTAANSTAVDAAWRVSGRLTRRLELGGGVSVSFESLDHVHNSDFSRVYLVPGLRYRLSSRMDFVTGFGVGLNSNSPSYLTTGFAMYLPTSGSAHGGERR
jgi:hypothetical protein